MMICMSALLVSSPLALLSVCPSITDMTSNHVRYFDLSVNLQPDRRLRELQVKQAGTCVAEAIRGRTEVSEVSTAAYRQLFLSCSLLLY